MLEEKFTFCLLTFMPWDFICFDLIDLIRRSPSFHLKPFLISALTDLTVSGAFAKLLKATLNFVMSVRVEKLGCNWTYCRYLKIFRKSDGKMKIPYYKRKKNATRCNNVSKFYFSPFI
jgi:hypothetical protein